MRQRDTILATVRGISRGLLIFYVPMIVAFPVVTWAFGVTLRQGWSILAGRHHGLLLILLLAPIVLLLIAMVQIGMQALSTKVASKFERRQ